jgi:small subunit ribosomal protein S6
VNLYETTFIVNPQADDASIDRQVRSVIDLISSNGGKILHENRMGTRRMAYEIQGLTQGYYASLVFEAPPQMPSLLNRHFRLEEPYVRHLTVLFEGSLEKLERSSDALADLSEDADLDTGRARRARAESDTVSRTARPAAVAPANESAPTATEKVVEVTASTADNEPPASEIAEAQRAEPKIIPSVETPEAATETEKRKESEEKTGPVRPAWDSEEEEL